MEITVKMSEKEFVNYIEYKKDKEIFLEKYKNKLIDILSSDYRCENCGERIWTRKMIRERIQLLKEKATIEEL
jgi:hypothetical protein